jgi:bifunctional DNA-binding transcriptional regulator/antitoxin component of YhaV-PrlF toxin-antitoxin module
MSVEESEKKTGEGAVSGNQASIPAEVREAADIQDGDRIRWYWEGDELRVEVVRKRDGTLSEDFDGFEPVGETVHHDEVGTEPAGKWDSGEEEVTEDEKGAVNADE